MNTTRGEGSVGSLLRLLLAELMLPGAYFIADEDGNEPAEYDSAAGVSRCCCAGVIPPGVNRIESRPNTFGEKNGLNDISL